MSNVQVLGAVELDVGTVSLLHYPNLAERNGQLRIADLPDAAFCLVNADTAKEEIIYVRVVQSGGTDYDREQIAKILGQKFKELLCLDGVVSIYGKLIWDANITLPEGQAGTYDPYAANPYHYGPQYRHVQELVDLLFDRSNPDRPGFRRYYRNGINVTSDGRTTISVALPGQLELAMVHPYENNSYGGHDKAVRGSLTGPNNESWAWSVNNGHRVHFDLRGTMDVDELQSVISAEFTKAYPWIAFPISNFVMQLPE